MKQILLNTAVGLLAGVAGAFAFTNWVAPKTDELGIYSQSNPDARYLQMVQNGGPKATNSGINTDFVTASAVATPTVVYIKTVSTVQNSMSFADMFFGGGGSYKQVGSGSGVIFTADGYVVTNNHVIENADNIEVIQGKRTYKAKLIGRDPNTDLAVLKIEVKSLPYIKIGDSRKLQVGEWVVAVGNPFNLTSTVTTGVVSAKGRNLNIVNSTFPIESFIQTDAAINPGNSGGALVNLRGELIGINTAIYSQTGSYNGYGFAVPSDIVEKIVRDLIKYGEVQKAFFGAEIADINTENFEKLDLNGYSGVVIDNLPSDGPASKAGLKKNDVIVKIDGNTIDSKANFDEEISYRDPGNQIKVTYKRGKETAEAMLTLVNREGTTGLLKRVLVESKDLDATFEPLSKVEKDKFKVTSGLRIVKIGNRSALRNFQLKEGYTIVSINNQTINEIDDLEKSIKNMGNYIVLGYLDPQGRFSKLSFSSY